MLKLRLFYFCLLFLSAAAGTCLAVGDLKSLGTLFNRENPQQQQNQQLRNRSETGSVTKNSDALRAAALEGEIRKRKFLNLQPDLLRGAAIVYQPLLPPQSKNSNPDALSVSLKRFNIYIFSGPEAGRCNSCSEDREGLRRPIIVVTNKKRHVIASFQSHRDTRIGPMFSLINLGQPAHETLVWSIHTGGADLAFDHYLIDLKNDGPLVFNTEFAPRFDKNEIKIRGAVAVRKDTSPILFLKGGQGQFLSIPRKFSPDTKLANVLDEVKVKSQFLIGALPVHTKVASGGEEELVLLQMDGSYSDFGPRTEESFIYKVIERRNGTWRNASHLEAAQAFYRAVADELFVTLSQQDGVQRNWTLASWAGYKAMLGEWDDARDIVQKKSDPVAYRQRACRVLALINGYSEADVEELHTISFIQPARGSKGRSGFECKAKNFTDFLESEFRLRGIFPKYSP